MTVVLLTNDLMVASRVDGAAQRMGVFLKSVATIDALVALCMAGDTSRVLVDLSTAALDIVALVEKVVTATTPAPPIIAFGPHVHESLLSAARSAGCDAVISRGQFFAQLDAIVSGAHSSRNSVTNG